MRITPPKPINLEQLQAELRAAGGPSDALWMTGDPPEDIGTYVLDGSASEFASDAQPIVQQVIADHVALRDKTDAELAAEFQDPNTTAVRKQELRDMQAGLLPREQVPMT